VSFPGQIFEEVVSVDETVDSLHEQSNTLVTETLTEEEAEEFRSKKVTKRANEWVVGRIALKRSVQRLLACRDHTELPARDIRITADGNGKPQVQVSDGDGSTMGEVSLSHSNGLAIAAAACEEGFLGVGIDLEQVQDRSQAWVEDCFTPDEIHRARNARDPQRVFTAMWALKEAALKALGMGLRIDLKTIDVQTPEQGGRAVIIFHQEARDMVEEKRIRSLDAWAEHVDGVVVARVIARA
jgi:phosphopantetheine--protein transferase-like protein